MLLALVRWDFVERRYSSTFSTLTHRLPYFTTRREYCVTLPLYARVIANEERRSRMPYRRLEGLQGIWLDRSSPALTKLRGKPWLTPATRHVTKTCVVTINYNK